MSGELPGGGIELSPAEIAALDARWSSSWTPDEVARYLAGIAAPWLLARVHPGHPWLADL